MLKIENECAKLIYEHHISELVGIREQITKLIKDLHILAGEDKIVNAHISGLRSAREIIDLKIQAKG